MYIRYHCAVLFSCQLNYEKVREVNRKWKYYLLDFWEIIQSPKLPWETLNPSGKCKISPFSCNVKQTLFPNIWLNYSVEAGSGNQIGGLSYIERSERSCIRNKSGVGRAERGLVSRKDGGRSGRAGFECGCIRDTARIQRVLIGDRYALHS